ncbi:MAG: hypothetical protein J2P16_07210 [Mycobacterium sp.]|nr:hypothetical protein [Mycobacterium sp.]
MTSDGYTGGYAPSDPRAWTTGRQVSLWLLTEQQRRQYKQWQARFDPVRDLWILPTHQLVPRWEDSLDVETDSVITSAFVDEDGTWIDEEPADLETRVARCGRCEATWTGKAVCHCAGCHLTFTSIGPFDAHRFNGKCRAPAELRSKGYQPNDEGHWRKPAPADLRTRFTKGRTA